MQNRKPTRPNLAKTSGTSQLFFAFYFEICILHFTF
jgi:hypothetical protein